MSSPKRSAPIEVLNIPKAAIRALHNIKLYTVEDVIQYVDENPFGLQYTRGIGKTYLRSISSALKAYEEGRKEDELKYG